MKVRKPCSNNPILGWTTPPPDDEREVAPDIDDQVEREHGQSDQSTGDKIQMKES